MSGSRAPRPVTVALHPALAPWGAEVKYVFRTVLRVAGLPYRFEWAGSEGGGTPDIWYGPPEAAPGGVMSIGWSGRPFDETCGQEDPASLEAGTVPLLRFGRDPRGAPFGESSGATGDHVYGWFWLLTGAREPSYRRDRPDNLYLDDAFWWTARLGSRPLVSQAGAFLREWFGARGHAPAPLPWTAGGRAAAFCLTHDVDHPVILRGVEVARLVARRGRRALPLVRRVVRGTSHFWQFPAWLEFAAELRATPAFYFMARKGSLLEYALGTPDGFYDVRADRFRRLFAELRDAGAEIGLHASFNAYRRAERLLQERRVLESAAGVTVRGNRHHYWHLDPTAPDETLRRGEAAGLRYDSTLAYEFYPGFRRGICHPFQPFHRGERRELAIVEVPPAWMDDHFGRRTAVNGITSPDDAATELLSVARAVGGAVVVNYHVRGMNAEFFPEYGPWLADFVRHRLTSEFSRPGPGALAGDYVAYARALEQASADATVTHGLQVQADVSVRVGAMEPDDVPAVARLHHEFFALGELHGHSMAKLGPGFLAEVFYRPNLDNPHFFVDVARLGREVVGFSVYVTDRHRVFRHTLRHHLVRAAWQVLRQGLLRPRTMLHLLGNLRYVRGEESPWLERTDAHWLLFAVRPEYRSREFERRAGTWLAGEMFRRMETTMAAHGCQAWYAAPGVHNPAINRFMERCGAEHVGTATAQGLEVHYWRRRLGAAETGVAEPPVAEVAHP